MQLYINKHSKNIVNYDQWRLSPLVGGDKFPLYSFFPFPFPFPLPYSLPLSSPLPVPVPPVLLWLDVWESA